MGEKQGKEPDNFNVDKVTHELSRVCFGYEIAALEYIEPLAQVLMDNPGEGIQQIRDAFKKGTEAAYGKDLAIVNAFCGGPAESLTWPLYNAVGAVYPYLDREKKDGALHQLFAIMDQRNYLEVNGEIGVGHTTGIREPLLLADIKIARWLYWPGLDEGKWVIKQFETFADLKSRLIDEKGMFRPKSSAHAVDGPPTGINSDFVVAYALLRNSYSDFGEEYAEAANPAFLERVAKGIVALRFGIVQSKKYIDQHGREESDKRVVNGMARLKEILPKSLHDRLEPLKQEADWVDSSKFP
ncbi:hypothetical protein GF343_03200 [Candidatus Woesearchaeota archaeon]|nr:hypothetical protein [Candidatus Woesearchaeota archaeon]